MTEYEGIAFDFVFTLISFYQFQSDSSGDNIFSCITSILQPLSELARNLFYLLNWFTSLSPLWFFSSSLVSLLHPSLLFSPSFHVASLKFRSEIVKQSFSRCQFIRSKLIQSFLPLIGQSHWYSDNCYQLLISNTQQNQKLYSVWSAWKFILENYYYF